MNSVNFTSMFYNKPLAITNILNGAQEPSYQFITRVNCAENVNEFLLSCFNSYASIAGIQEFYEVNNKMQY